MLLIDLQMPEACDVCPLNYDFCWCRGFKEGEFDKYSDDWNDQVCEGEHRPEYCPLKEIVRCKDCKHFEIKDYWADFGGVPILATSDCPTCNKWADGCMTKPDGYCFMAERRD